jgi:transcriptional regulator with XRE-family HTH domain
MGDPSQFDSAWSEVVLRTFGARIRALRHDLAISQQELAFRSGLQSSYVGQMERGRHNPSLQSICRLAAGLRMSPINLLRPLERNLGFKPHDG